MIVFGWIHVTKLVELEELLEKSHSVFLSIHNSLGLVFEIQNTE